MPLLLIVVVPLLLKVFAGTPENSRSSPSTLTTPVMSQVVGGSDQPFIMVSNPNYVHVSMATTPPPSAQQANVCAKQQCMYSEDYQRHQDYEHNDLIKKIYDHRMGRRQQQMLEGVRERHDHLSTWLCLEIKKALYVY
ncbi:hypothetical protein Ahy_B03g066391 isoform A [Arachis hypogaea]|uniref:Uncharacterized protein n=1 Tax=Arachis hypogaea TaxID=3818 RepID=A0A445A3V7_ARAHY|nr:hypothetical protein Ahy_B03g066391 isoform A [Arachis hypogaea]